MLTLKCVIYNININTKYKIQIKWQTHLLINLFQKLFLQNQFMFNILFTLLIAMSKVSHVEGFIPIWAKHTVGILLFTKMLSWYGHLVLCKYQAIQIPGMRKKVFYDKTSSDYIAGNGSF